VGTLVDLKDKKFGYIKVLSITKERKWGWVVWNCICDCGKKIKVPGPSLTSGHVKSCGCKKGSNYRLVGKRFGKLVVTKRVGSNNHGSAIWECRCDCGCVKTVDSSALVRGFTKSCGCLHHYEEKDRAAKNLLYSRYRRHAKERGYCFDIQFEDFFKITSNECYYCGRLPKNVAKLGNSMYAYNGIDRIDNTKGYTIDNCVPCCFCCNRAKDKREKDEYIVWIKNSYECLKHKGYYR
jgi:hypothetical protein